MNFDKMLDDMTDGFTPSEPHSKTDLSSNDIEKMLDEMIDKKLASLLPNASTQPQPQPEPQPQPQPEPQPQPDDTDTDETKIYNIMKDEVK